jgi:hypothetical protein
MNNEEQLLAWVEEALELRHGEADDPLGKLELPPYTDGPDGVLNTLRRVRVRLDRVEELQSRSRQMKGKVSRSRAKAEFDADLAEHEAMKKQANRGREFVSAAQLKAEASLDSIEQKRILHRLKKLESMADEAYEIIKTCYWGLDKIRTELLEMLRVHNTMPLAVENQT